MGGVLGGVISQAHGGNSAGIQGAFPFRASNNLGVEFAAEFFAVFFFVLVILRCACSKANAGMPTAGVTFIYYVFRKLDNPKVWKI